MTGAIKGLPKNKISEDDYRQLLESGEISANLSILPTFKSYMKGNRVTKEMVRRSTNLHNSKSWKLVNGKIEPVTL